MAGKTLKGHELAEWFRLQEEVFEAAKKFPPAKTLFKREPVSADEFIEMLENNIKMINLLGKPEEATYLSTIDVSCQSRGDHSGQDRICVRRFILEFSFGESVHTMSDEEKKICKIT